VEISEAFLNHKYTKNKTFTALKKSYSATG
jgi:hypothetical protein